MARDMTSYAPARGTSRTAVPEGAGFDLRSSDRTCGADHRNAGNAGVPRFHRIGSVRGPCFAPSGGGHRPDPGARRSSCPMVAQQECDCANGHEDGERNSPSGGASHLLHRRRWVRILDAEGSCSLLMNRPVSGSKSVLLARPM